MTQNPKPKTQNEVELEAFSTLGTKLHFALNSKTSIVNLEPRTQNPKLPTLDQVEPKALHYSLPHNGTVNRLRCMPHKPQVVATMSEYGDVHIYGMSIASLHCLA